MNQKKIIKVLQSGIIMALGLSVMGNSSCGSQKAQDDRQLRRRVQMGKIQAPPLELPPSFGGKKFDFAYVANMQMYDILRTTKSFSTATVDPNQNWDIADLDDSAKDDFNRCEEEQEASVYSMTTGQALSAKVSQSKMVMSNSAACFIHMPQAVISGEIIDFQLTNGGGIQLGLLGGIVTGLEFNFESYRLDVGLKAKAPLETGDHYIETTLKQSYGRKMGVGVGLNLGAVTLGPKYYFQSSMAKVVNEGLTNAVTDLSARWSKEDPWYAMILKACDKYIYLNAGFGNDAGLKVGDILEVRNVQYAWNGDPCKSKLHGEVAQAPMAYARVVSTGRNLSAAEIIERDPKYPHIAGKIYPGSRVYFKKSIEQVNAEQAEAQKKAGKN